MILRSCNAYVIVSAEAATKTIGTLTKHANKNLELPLIQLLPKVAEELTLRDDKLDPPNCLGLTGQDGVCEVYQPICDFE